MRYQNKIPVMAYLGQGLGFKSTLIQTNSFASSVYLKEEGVCLVYRLEDGDYKATISSELFDRFIQEVA